MYFLKADTGALGSIPVGFIIAQVAAVVVRRRTIARPRRREAEGEPLEREPRPP